MWRGVDGGGKFCIEPLFIFWIPSCDEMVVITQLDCVI